MNDVTTITIIITTTTTITIININLIIHYPPTPNTARGLLPGERLFEG